MKREAQEVYPLATDWTVLPAWFRWLIWFSLLVLSVLFLSEMQDLTAGDLGRHLKNGEVLILGSWHDKLAVLRTNFYSYTNPDFPFVNHHWLTGILFYLVYRTFDFEGLTVFYAILGTVAFWFIYRTAEKSSATLIAAPLAFLALPFITQRAEVRPEVFTYLFSAIFYWLLAEWQAGRAPEKRLYALPVVMLLWVNLHIGFVFGFLILGMFGLKEFQRNGGRLKLLIWIAGACAACALINPHFAAGLIYPLNIFKNYGYEIAENQSILRSIQFHVTLRLHLTLLAVWAGLAVVSFLGRGLAERNLKSFPFPELLLCAVLGTLALTGVRSIPIFGFLTLPIVSENFTIALSRLAMVRRVLATGPIRMATFAALALPVWLFAIGPDYRERAVVRGTGLGPFVNATGEFLKDERITGPIFNNFDNGGYLIFYLYRPVQPLTGQGWYAGAQVFVDNRPEAYPAQFFDKIYRPMQYDENVWRRMDAQYQFNAIVFAHRDHTWWSQQFLIARVKDPGWAPVFGDPYNIVLVRRNAKNADLIRRSEIPKSAFSIVNE